MPTQEAISRYLDFSGGQQTATSRLLMRDNELVRAENARYNKRIGGITRRPGHEIVGFPIQNGKRVNGSASYSQKDGNNKLLVAIDNSGSTFGTIQHEQQPYWNSVIATLGVGTKIRFENFLDQAFAVGYSSSLDQYMQTMSINGKMVTSTTDNVYNAPRAKIIMKYQDSMYAINCWVDGKKYPNRAYKSSTPTDAITSVNGNFVGTKWQLEVDSVRYLKAGMIIDIYGENSSNKKVDSLTIISVDRANNKISFAPTSINISDRDEVYLEDKKGTLVILWNTDYPNPQTSDFLEIPSVINEIPDLTGAAENNNRMILFTSHSMWKWDGANLVNISKVIGTTSHDSIAYINGYTMFLHNTGVWGYNDATGDLKCFSRQIQNYIDAINQINLSTAVGIARGDIYKVAVGELLDIDARTTSTSTSSTSTSSTSSSTSSTSTSSTSTSSTSTSVSATTSTSTSSTSSSTSSTSSSTSSTSTSSTSTSTTTAIPTREITQFVFDFTAGGWAVDKINREVTTAIVHKMHGYEKMYFGDDTGRFYRDETGTSDNGAPVQLLIETKRLNQDLPEELKKYRRIFVYTQDGQEAMFYYSVDGGEWQSLGQLRKNVTSFDLGDIDGRDIAFRVVQNNSGESVTFLGVSVIFLRGENDATRNN